MAKPRRGTKNAPRRPNRSQQRAMEARAAATAPARPAAKPAPNGETDEVPVGPALTAQPRPQAQTQTGRTSSTSRGRSQQRSRPVAKPMALSREQEYRYVRVDLIRLFTITGVLLLGMFLMLIFY